MVGSWRNEVRRMLLEMLQKRAHMLIVFTGRFQFAINLIKPVRQEQG